jgi:hypothetical protein
MIRPKCGNRLPSQFKVINNEKLKKLNLDLSYDLDLLNILEITSEMNLEEVNVDVINLVV